MATNIVFGPATINLRGIRAGDANLMTATITVSSQPLNLSGYTVQAQARKTAPDTKIAITAAVNIENATAGKIAISWPGDQVRTALANNETWSGVWDLQITGPDGPQTVAAGAFEAVMDVTR
jgi:hypothetical protein